MPITSADFALLSMRSPTISRLYLQCAPDEDINEWPDDRIWQELARAAGRGRRQWKLTEGPSCQKGVTGMRSFVAEPMQYGKPIPRRRRGAHCAADGSEGPQPGGLGRAACSRALSRSSTGRDGKTCVENYSKTCLRRVWKAQRFSWWMTSMLHLFDTDNAFDRRRQLAELDYVTSSRAASQTLAENYVGLPIE